MSDTNQNANVLTVTRSMYRAPATGDQTSTGITSFLCWSQRSDADWQNVSVLLPELKDLSTVVPFMDFVQPFSVCFYFPFLFLLVHLSECFPFKISLFLAFEILCHSIRTDLQIPNSRESPAIDDDDCDGGLRVGCLLAGTGTVEFSHGATPTIVQATAPRQQLPQKLTVST